MSFINRKFLLLILLIMLCFNLLLLFSINQLETECSLYKKEIDFHKQNTEKIKYYETLMQIGIQNNNIQLNKEIIFTDSLNRQIFITDIFSEGLDYILLCRFSERYCEDCILNAFRELKKQTDITITNKLLLLGLYDTNRGLNLLKSTYGISEIRVYNTKEFNIPAEKVGYPYYFVMDKTLRISDVFFPDKSTPEITEQYLKLIKNRYFNEK